MRLPLVTAVLLLAGLSRQQANVREGKSFAEVFTFMENLMKTNSKDISQKALGSITEENDIVNEGKAVLIFRLNELKLLLPTAVDNAVQTITESIAKRNMIDYTIGAAFIFAAAVDTVSEFFIQERNLLEAFTELEAIFIYGYLWSYAIGFAGPFLIGLEDPVQDCSSLDVLKLLDEFELDAQSVVNMTRLQLFLFSSKFRTSAEKQLFCVISKTDRFVDAAVVKTLLDESIDIIQLIYSFATAPPSLAAASGNISEVKLSELRKDLDELDQELHAIWNVLETQVVEAYNFAYASRVSQNIIKVMIGIPNVLGLVFGILSVAETFDAGNIPAAADIPGVLADATTTAMTEGRATNEFFFGELLNILGHQGWGYGYYAPLFTAIIDPTPECGVNQFHDVIRSYRDFQNFTETFGTADEIITGTRVLRLETLPKYASYRIKRFSRELKLGLHCILSRREKTATTLLFSIEDWLSMALYRMELTSSIFSTGDGGI